MVSRCLSAGAQLNFQHHPTKDPYRNLFVGTPVDQKPVAREADPGANTPQKPVVACGTLVVPSDPTGDPKIRVGPREDGVGHTMRVLAPPACNAR
jgi:hypothetical protein